MATRYVWDEIGERTIIKGFHGKFVHSERMTFVMWRFDAGTILPRHQHPHEQVAIVLEGELEITVDGETFRSTAGSVLVIPPNAWHEGNFSPRRGCSMCSRRCARTIARARRRRSSTRRRRSSGPRGSAESMRSARRGVLASAVARHLRAVPTKIGRPS